MAVTGEQLQDIVFEYGDMSSLTGSALVEKCAAIRKSLKKIIAENLTNIEVISKELKKTKGKSSQTEIILDFICHLVRKFPHPVFVPTPDQFLHLDAVLQERFRNECKEFTRWIWHSLLSLLCESVLEDIHSIVVTLLVTLLELFKTKNITMLSGLLIEMVTILAELNRAHEMDMSFEDGSSDVYPVTLGGFTAPERGERSHLIIRDFVSLECARDNCCSLLKEFVVDICQFANNQIESVWCVALFQLEYGRVKLKSKSLDILRKLLMLQGVPSSKLLHHFIYCSVACVELVVETLQGKNEGLRPDKDWPCFVKCLSEFLKELFAVEKITSPNVDSIVVSCYAAKHVIGDEYLTALCHYLSTELQQIYNSEGTTDEELQFISSLIGVVEYLCVNIRTLIHSDTPLSSFDHDNVDLLEKLLRWMLDSGYLSQDAIVLCGVQTFAHCIVVEMEAKCSAQESELVNLKLCKTLESFCRRYVEDLVSTSNENVTDADGFEMRVSHVENYKLCLQIVMRVFQSLETDTVLGNIPQNYIFHLLSSFLNANQSVLLMESLLKIAKNSLESEDWPRFVCACVNLIQSHSTLLHCADAVNSGDTKSYIAQYCEKTMFYFTSYVSLPWLNLPKLEDFDSDFKSSELRVTFLNPISEGLEQRGLTLGCESSADAVPNLVFDCLKTLSLLHTTKYGRFRSTVLFKRAIGMKSHVTNIALAFLPFFIVKALSETPFKGMLTHVRTVVKDLETRFCHSSLFAIAILVHRVTMLMSSPCEIELIDEPNAACCVNCAPFQPCVDSFKLVFKKKPGNAKKQRDDVVQLLGVIVSEVYKIMDGRWVLFESCVAKPDYNLQTKVCFNALQVTIIEMCSNYLEMIKGRPLTDTTRMLSKKWLESLQYCTSASLDERIAALNLKTGSEQSRKNMRILEEILRTAINDRNLDLRLTLNEIFGALASYSLVESESNIGCCELFSWSLSQLFAALSSTLSLVQSSAYLILNRLQQNGALQKYRYVVSVCFAKTLTGGHQHAGNRPALDLLEDVAQLYHLETSTYLLQNMQTILPIVITSEKQKKLLKLLSETLNITSADLLMPNFKHIFCHAIVSDYDLDLLFRYLAEEIRLERESLILLNFGALHHHLVSYISVDVNKIHKAIDAICKVKESSGRKVKKSSSLSSVRDLLHPHFLGILTFFNSQLRSALVIPEEKRNIIESLTCLLKLMKSKDVTAVRVKIINTLCIAQQLFKLSSWYDICCTAWNAFVRRVDTGCLGPLLSHITVTILPLLDILPKPVTVILSYLVVERISDTSDHHHELYFLPDHPLLREINQKVRAVIKSQNGDDLKTQLTQATELLSHESSEVRVHALTKLRMTLKERQRDIQRHHATTGQDSSDEVMSNLVSKLLLGCRDLNKAVRLLCGQCLGLIGAIDPDRLVLNLHGDTSVSEFFTVDIPDFAFHLISQLVKAFLAAKPIDQDISAYAIQELLKIYDCRDGSKDNHGRRLWRKFPESIREVLEPHHTSRYLLKKKEWLLENLKQPVLFRKPNMTFRDWAGMYCSLLMQMVYENDKARTASKVFHACSAVTRNDINTALFLMPHTTLQALLHTNHADFIVQEVLTILEQTDQSKGPIHQRHSIDQPISQDSSANLINAQHARGTHLLQLSAQAVFSALDHVTRWLRQAEIEASDQKSKSSSQVRSVHVEKVKAFLGRIPQLLLAQASFHCRAYRRALLHYEAHLRGKNADSARTTEVKVDEEAINFLQQIFVEMDEPDGVAGIAAVRSARPTLSIQIKQLESTGKLQDACACYAHAIERNPDDLRAIKDYVKCLMNLGQLSTATCLLDGTISKRNSWQDDLESFRIEAAWRLGRWDSLDKYLNSDSRRTDLSQSHDWNARLGQLLLVVKEKRWDQFRSIIDDVYLDQTGPLSAATMERGSYQRGYKAIIRLHMLTELEDITEKLKSTDGDTDMKQVAMDCYRTWQERLQPIQNSFKTREPILCLQRAVLDLLERSHLSKQASEDTGDTVFVKNLVGKLWLQTAKHARKAGYLQSAYNALINAQDMEIPEFCIERAKWLWDKGESHEALLTLQKGVADYFPDAAGNSTVPGRAEKMSTAKAMLLVARLMEESSSSDSNTILKHFREAVAFMPEWEDSHFYAAKYYDKLMSAFMGENRNPGKAGHLFYIMNHYGRSLCYGTSHIYESLTKLLTVWLDYEANIAKLEKANKPYNKDDAKKLTGVVSDLRDRLPAYVFLTAFSQLVSRICHPHLPTFEELKLVVAKVIRAYPQQALWTLMAISKSSYPKRAARCKEIFKLAELKDRKLSKIISDATRLTDKLLELCNKPASTMQSLSISTHFKPLKRLVEEDSFSEILLPLQRYMTVTLPRNEFTSHGTSTTQESKSPMRRHNPFPDKAIYIVGFEDTIEVLPSLQRPKKINIRASDGKTYLFLCKPKDDLRKDARLMEFNTIVNKCLKLDSETRRRQLNIRTYAVVPLNEECGLIEWVPNTKGFRPILLKIYRSRDLYTSVKAIKSLQLPYTAPLEKKLDVFRNKLMARHPAVFGDWFLTTFPDPTSWYAARLAYARSTAVMSMVGYILGLGDRHGENILFDSTTGEAVHVDFNCLFNKGLTLDVPEIVPFRLTHNMTDAMGPMRYEGFFRCACEAVMRLLRQQREPLMSVLKTFIYDPLVEWSKRSRDQTNESGEIMNEMALSHVNDIDKRLRGFAAKNKCLPLSVEGHVHYLIQEATDETKLCQMYIGWAPYM